jgi:hypothetical protein
VLQGVEDLYHFARRSPIIERLISGNGDTTQQAAFRVEHMDVSWRMVANPPQEQSSRHVGFFPLVYSIRSHARATSSNAAQ